MRRPVEPGQYTSWAFGQRLRHAGLLGSMGTVGDALDNAVAESFFATLQTELLDRHHWKTRRVLQPGQAALHPGHAQPGRLRQNPPHPDCGMIITATPSPSGKPGELQNRRTERVWTSSVCVPRQPIRRPGRLPSRESLGVGERPDLRDVPERLHLLLRLPKSQRAGGWAKGGRDGLSSLPGGEPAWSVVLW